MTDNDRWVLEMMTEDESRLITPRSRQAIAAALAELDALRAEVEKLRAENERLRGQEGSQSVLNL
jgi:cell division protein FtsB